MDSRTLYHCIVVVTVFQLVFLSVTFSLPFSSTDEDLQAIGSFKTTPEPAFNISVLLEEEEQASTPALAHWIYTRNGVQFYMDSDLKANPKPTRGSRPLPNFISLIDTGEIQFETNKAYVGISGANQKLNPVLQSSNNTRFLFIPVLSALGESDRINTFHLIYTETSDYIVTPRNRPPFDFYLNSRYPDIIEPAQFIFAWNTFSVAELYCRSRDNTRCTLEAIRNLAKTDKQLATQYYMELLEITRRLEHWSGKELFLITSYVKDDLGIESEPFQALPKQVKLAFSDGLLRLQYNLETLEARSSNGEGPAGLALTFHDIVNSTYMDSPGTDLPQELVYPFTFTYNSSIALWSIVVHNKAHNCWYVNLDFNRLEHGQNCHQNQQHFALYLNPDLRSFQIQHGAFPSFSSLRTLPKSANFYTSLPTSEYEIATFTLNPYVLNVTWLYAGIRTHVQDTLHLINTFSADKASDYKKLIDLVEEYGQTKGGSEIFTIGMYIKNDLGTSTSSPFQQLPTQVKLLLKEEPATVKFYYYSRSTNASYPIKYAYASDLHGDIAPYQFTLADDVDNPTVSISYGEEYQLDMAVEQQQRWLWSRDAAGSGGGSSNGNGILLTDVMSTTLKPIFKISTSPNNASLFCLALKKYPEYVISPTTEEPDYYFTPSKTSPPAEFFVKEYSVGKVRPATEDEELGIIPVPEFVATNTSQSQKPAGVFGDLDTVFEEGQLTLSEEGQSDLADPVIAL